MVDGIAYNCIKVGQDSYGTLEFHHRAFEEIPVVSLSLNTHSNEPNSVPPPKTDDEHHPIGISEPQNGSLDSLQDADRQAQSALETLIEQSSSRRSGARRTVSS